MSKCGKCGEWFEFPAYKVEGTSVMNVTQIRPNSYESSIGAFQIRKLLPMCPICGELLYDALSTKTGEEK